MNFNMNSIQTNQLQDRLNRRLFMRGGAQVVGTAALASLMSNDLKADIQAAGLKDPIGLPGFPNGRTVADGSLRSKAFDEGSQRRRSTSLDSPGPAIDHHDFRAEDFSGCTVDI